MKCRSFLTLAALLIAPLATAQAQTPPASASRADAQTAPLTTERPGFTNGTDIVPVRHVQLETGYVFAHQGGADSHHLDDSAEFRVPFQTNIEARINLPVYYLAGAGNGGSGVSSTGFGDFGVSAKWKFLPEETGHRPALALIAGSSVPSGAPSLRANHAQPFADLEAQYSLGALYQVQVNGIYARDDSSSGNGTFGQFSSAVSLSYTLTANAGTFIQAQRITPTDSGGMGNATNVDGGFTYTLGRNIQLDASAGLTTNAPSRSDHFYGVGFSERW